MHIILWTRAEAEREPWTYLHAATELKVIQGLVGCARKDVSALLFTGEYSQG